MRVGAGAAVLGAVALAIGLIVAPQQVAASYLVAYTASVAIGIGLLLLVIAAHLSGAVWFALMRRQAERALGALPALAVLGIPLVAAPRAFWPGDRRVSLLIVRAIVYWAVWIAAAYALRSLSFRQDRDPHAVPLARLRAVSAGAAPVVALALSCAAVDWVMAVTPGWSSSVFGAYYFAGAMVSALACIGVLMRVASAPEWYPRSDHYQALGRLMLAFVLFWGYLWYVQFFIIWIADIPAEVEWYVVRLGGWADVAAVLLIGGFAVPVIVLLFRIARGSRVVMFATSALLLAAHYLDLYWLIVPSMRPQWSATDLLWDAGALAFVGGVAVALALWRMEGRAPVPAGDPLLALSVRYESH